MGGEATKPKKEEATEVLTMHPNWESHVNEETNSGVFFSFFNIHISCSISTLMFCLGIMICILLGYLRYRRFCHRPKKKSREAPSTGATCSSCAAPPAPLTSRPWATNMEDKYYDLFYYCARGSLLAMWLIKYPNLHWREMYRESAHGAVLSHVCIAS
jgi:hypothetical protein